MRGVQEIYTQSLCQDSKVLWPTHLFKDVEKVYAFDADHVFEKAMFTDGFESKEKYILILSPADASFVEGIYNRESGIALMNERLISTERFPSIQLEQLEVETVRRSADPMIHYLQDKEDSVIQTVKEKLSMARYYNNGIRAIYDSALDKEIVKEMKDDIINKIFQKKRGENREAVIDAAYFGTNAASGPFYMTQFYEDMDHCFILKGQGTSMGSIILGEIAKLANTLGYHSFHYYCPFYTNEMDGIVIPELKAVILESEPPHEVEPLHPNEIVMPLGEKCRHKEIVFSHSLELRELESKYKQLMRQAMMQLQDYRKYKRQELNLSNKYHRLTSEKVSELLKG